MSDSPKPEKERPQVMGKCGLCGEQAPLGKVHRCEPEILPQLKDWVATEYSLALKQKQASKELRCYGLARVHDSYAKAMAKVLWKIEQLTQSIPGEAEGR